PNTNVDSGDTVTVTVRVQETNAGSAIAYEGRIAYTMPTGLSANGTFSSGTCGGIVSNTISSGSAVFDFTTIPDATDCTFTFDVDLNSSAVFGSTINLTSDVTWTSFPGTLTTSQSTFSTVATERTGSTSDPGGALNTYSGTDTEGLTVSDFGLGLSTTGPLGDVRIGDLITYAVTVTIPEGTSGTSITLVDPLPDGLVFVSDANFTASGALTCSVSCSSPTRVVAAGGGQVEYTFGTISNSDTTDATPETITFDVVAAVANVAAVADGTAITNEVQIGSISATSGAVTVREPSMTVGVSLPTGPFDSGDTMTVTVNLAESAATSAAAYDAVVDVTLPTGLANATNFNAGTCPSPASQALGAASANLTFSTIADGTSCSFTFDVTVQDAAVINGMPSVGAALTWTSFPGDLTSTQSTFGTATERTGSTS
ncbi:MAG: hypothetical protein AAGK78_12260, partial [Planctomycetota bacterium]